MAWAARPRRRVRPVDRGPVVSSVFSRDTGARGQALGWRWRAPSRAVTVVGSTSRARARGEVPSPSSGSRLSDGGLAWRLLLVEDDPTLTLSLEVSLTALGHEVRSVRLLKEARPWSVNKLLT